MTVAQFSPHTEVTCLWHRSLLIQKWHVPVAQFSPHIEVACACGTVLSYRSDVPVAQVSPHTEVACACGTVLSSYRSDMCLWHSSLLIQKWHVPVAQVSPHTEVTCLWVGVGDRQNKWGTGQDCFLDFILTYYLFYYVSP